MAFGSIPKAREVPMSEQSDRGTFVSETRPWSGNLTSATISWFLGGVMARRICYAALVSIAAAFPALAQTVATPGSVTRNGVVTLGTGSAVSAVSPTTNPTTVAQPTP